jgi:hypothetical protein
MIRDQELLDARMNSFREDAHVDVSQSEKMVNIKSIDEMHLEQIGFCKPEDYHYFEIGHLQAKLEGTEGNPKLQNMYLESLERV